MRLSAQPSKGTSIPKVFLGALLLLGLFPMFGSAETSFPDYSLKQPYNIRNWQLQPLASDILILSYQDSVQQATSNWDPSSNWSLSSLEWSFEPLKLDFEANLLSKASITKSFVSELNSNLYSPSSTRANFDLTYHWSPSIAFNAGLDYSYAHFFGTPQFQGWSHELRSMTPSLGLSKSFSEHTSLDLDLRYFNSQFNSSDNLNQSNWNVQTQFLIRF